MAFEATITKDVKPWGDFDVFPQGLYLIEIQEVREAKAGTGSPGYSFRSLVLDVVEISAGFDGDVDQFVGRALWDNFYNNQDPEIPEWLQKRLKMMFMAVGVPADAFAGEGFKITDDTIKGLAGEQVLWQVTTRENPNTGNPRNNIQAWLSLDELA